MANSYPRKSYTRKQDNSPAAQLERAIANAQKNDVRVIGQGTMKADGAKFYICPSQSVAGMCHVVKVGAKGLECDCFYSSERGKVCAHRAATFLHLRAEAEAKKATPAPQQPAKSAPAQPVKVSPEFQKRIDSTIFPAAAPVGTMAQRGAEALPYQDEEPFSIYKSDGRPLRGDPKYMVGAE